MSASSSEKGSYDKSMMWHSMCKFFGSLFVFEKNLSNRMLRKQWNFKNFEGN